MKSNLRLLAALALPILLAACAGPVPKIDATPDKLTSVKTIAVIRPPEPKTYTVANFGHPGVAFGLVGGLVAAADQSNKQDWLAGAFKSQGAAFSANLADQVAAKLSSSGYEARVEDGPWEEADGKYKMSFEKINSTADAVLVLSPTIIGFIATGLTADYVPTMTIVATLVGKDRKDQLYRGFHASGWKPKAEGWRFSSSKVGFSNFDVLMSDTKAAATSLNDAGAAIAETVSADFRR